MPAPALPYDAFDELPVAYLEIDAKGVILRANRTALALLPHETDALVGETVWNIMAADETEMSRAAFFKIMASGENPSPIRRSFYTCTGEFRTFELHRSLIRDAQGRPAGIRTVSFDVTEAQIAHEETQQARQWLESVLASITEAVMVTDALGFVCFVNPAAEELVGWSAPELIGKVIEKALPRLSYTSADGNPLSYRTVLERRTKGVATLLDRERRELRVEISTSPVFDRDRGFTTGVVTVLRPAEDAR